MKNVTIFFFKINLFGAKIQVKITEAIKSYRFSGAHSFL